jgi:hypothetical protein
LDPLDTKDIHEALSSHEESLENIVLDHPDSLDEQEDDNFAPIDFSAFEKLEYLQVSVKVCSLLIGQPIVAQALLVLSFLSSQALLPS